MYKINNQVIIEMVRWITHTSYFLRGWPNKWCRNYIYGRYRSLEEDMIMRLKKGHHLSNGSNKWRYFQRDHDNMANEQ
jgi:hypothetical protein